VFRKKDLFRIDAIKKLEHRGKSLVVWLTDLFYVVQFVDVDKTRALRLKNAFAPLTGLPVEGDPDKFVWEREYTIGIVVLVAIVLRALYKSGVFG
jgi:hypothetical protein